MIFFCDIGKKHSDKIPATFNPLLANEYSVNKQNSKFHFTTVDTRQVEKVFGKFKSSMGSGPDGIANFFLKAGLPILAESLCDIFNLSLATGVFPDCLKVARVALMFKNGEQNDRSNYGPIPVLPFSSRVFEKLVYNQLHEYLDENKHIFLHQFGFRSLHSVVTSLLNNTNDCYTHRKKVISGVPFRVLQPGTNMVPFRVLWSTP